MSYKLRSPDYAFAIAGLCSLLLGVALDLSGAEWVIRHLSYWVLLLSFGAFLYSIYRVFHEQRALLTDKARIFFRGWMPVFLLFVVVAIYALQPSGYKVVMDEPLLVSSSRQLHLEKQLYVPESCYELGGAYYNFDGYVDKRPGFFPFLLSLLHDLTGYRSSQGFVLNALLVPILVLLVSFLSDRLWPDRGKFLGPSLLLTVPLIFVAANSSGYDFLNLVLLLSVLLLALFFYRHPGKWSLNALLWAVVLTAHTRYESAIYLLPALLIICLRSFQIRQTFTSWIVSLVPVALVPVLLLIRVIGGQEDPLQLREGEVAAFSISHVVGNLRSAADFFFELGGGQPNSWLLSVLSAAAVVAGLVLIVIHLRRRSDADQISFWPVYILMSFGLLAYIGMISFYHWGQLNDPAATRLALPIISAQILMVVAVCGRLFVRPVLASALILVIIVYFLVFTLPASIKTDFLDDYPPARWAQWQKAKALEYKDENVLFVTQQRLVPVIEEVSAISIGKALGSKEKIALHHEIGTFTRILFVQLLVPVHAGELTEAIPLQDHFVLEELERVSIGAGQVVTLSELKVVRLTESEKRLMGSLVPSGLNLPMEWFQITPSTLP